MLLPTGCASTPSCGGPRLACAYLVLVAVAVAGGLVAPELAAVVVLVALVAIGWVVVRAALRELGEPEAVDWAAFDRARASWALAASPRLDR